MPTLTKKEWIKQATDEMKRRADVSDDLAKETATSLADDFYEDGFEPKFAVDDELSYWIE